MSNPISIDWANFAAQKKVTISTPSTKDDMAISTPKTAYHVNFSRSVSMSGTTPTVQSNPEAKDRTSRPSLYYTTKSPNGTPSRLPVPMKTPLQGPPPMRPRPARRQSLAPGKSEEPTKNPAVNNLKRSTTPGNLSAGTKAVPPTSTPVSAAEDLPKAPAKDIKGLAAKNDLVNKLSAELNSIKRELKAEEKRHELCTKKIAELISEINTLKNTKAEEVIKKGEEEDDRLQALRAENAALRAENATLRIENTRARQCEEENVAKFSTLQAQLKQQQERAATAEQATKHMKKPGQEQYDRAEGLQKAYDEVCKHGREWKQLATNLTAQIEKEKDKAKHFERLASDISAELDGADVEKSRARSAALRISDTVMGRINDKLWKTLEELKGEGWNEGKSLAQASMPTQPAGFAAEPMRYEDLVADPLAEAMRERELKQIFSGVDKRTEIMKELGASATAEQFTEVLKREGLHQGQVGTLW